MELRFALGVGLQLTGLCFDFTFVFLAMFSDVNPNPVRVVWLGEGESDLDALAGRLLLANTRGCVSSGDASAVHLRGIEVALQTRPLTECNCVWLRC